MTPHSQSERTVHLTAAEANQIWAQDYPSESSSGSSKSHVSFDKAERSESGRSTSRPSKDYGSVDRGEWSDSRSSRDTAQTGRQSRNTRTANVDEETEVLFPTRQSRPEFRPRKIVVPAEFRNTSDLQDEGYESDTSPRSHHSSHARSHSHRQSSDEGYESSPTSSHSRDTDRSHSSTSPTSGRSLTRSRNKKSASQANTSRDTSSRVSKVESDRHRRRHSKKQYLPSTTTDSHSHNPQHRTMEPSTSSRRETDPSASDLSCYPLSPQKKRLRVGYKVDKPEDWAQNYWKSDLVTMENDENRPNFATPQIATVDRQIEANAEKILREGTVSRLPSGVTMTDEERSKYAKSRIAFLAESELAVTNAPKIRQWNRAQKVRQQETGEPGQFIPETEITKEQRSIIAEADQSFVPTTDITMKDRFPIMYDMGLSGLHSLNDEDSDNASLREEALDEIDSALSRLSDEDAGALESELQEFTESKFTRQSQMDTLGYDMLSHHNTTSFFAPNTKSGHQKKHAVDALAFTLSGNTVICDDVTALRTYLDTGKDIDASFSRSNKRAFLLSSEDRVADRDYTSTDYMPIRSLDAETTQAARDAIISHYNTFRSTFAPDHDRTAGGSRTEARSRRLHELRIRRPLESVLQSEVDKASDAELDGLDEALFTYEQHLAGITYQTEETFAKLYPELSTYRTYGEVLDASEAAKDSGLARRWRRQKCLADMSSHVLLKGTAKGTAK